MSNYLPCQYSHRCSGCDLIYFPAEIQVSKKKHHLQNFWQLHVAEESPDIGFHRVGRGGFRSWVDFQVRGRKLGIFDVDRRDLLDLSGCPQMSPPLEEWYQRFRDLVPVVDKMSVRLRVAPNGQTGVWLDMSNIDVRNLFDERTQLERLLDVTIVEIGQRRKRLVSTDRLRLTDPILEPWWETYVGPDSRAIPVFGTIGSFSQPGFATNRVLTSVLRGLIENSAARRVLELGSGSGNLTFPLAHYAESVLAVENDALALEALGKGAAHAGLQNIKTIQHDFQSQKAPLPDLKIDTVVADPARPGLMHMLDRLRDIEFENFIYVSCFAESFCRDSRKLYDMGFKLKEWHIVDQFPQSQHYEVLARFKKNK